MELKRKITSDIRAVLILILFVFGLSFGGPYNFANAESPEQLKQKINELNQEINKTNSQLREKSGQRKTLESELGDIEDQIYKVQLEINKTQNELTLVNTEIEGINKEIKKAEDELALQKENLKENLKVFYEEGQVSSIEVIASSDNFSEYMDRTEYLRSIQDKMVETVTKIKALKEELDKKRKDLETKKTQLSTLKNQQVSQRQAVEIQKNTKNNLIAQTRGEEAEFQKQIKEKQAQEAEFWSAYQKAIQTSSPSNGSNYKGGAGSGYFIMPESGSLTQDYGCTDFAQCGNPYGPYGGKIHNGIDLSCGGPCTILAAATGTVINAAYGMNGGWGNTISIEHPNGLVTLYAHLSSISVSVGQTVTQGQVIGAEGSTGFSTGSHLHFSVYTNYVQYGNIPGYDGSANPWAFL